MKKEKVECWKITVACYERRAEAIVRGKTKMAAVISNTTYEFISLPGKGTQANKAIY